MSSAQDSVNRFQKTFPDNTFNLICTWKLFSFWYALLCIFHSNEFCQLNSNNNFFYRRDNLVTNVRAIYICCQRIGEKVSEMIVYIPKMLLCCLFMLYYIGDINTKNLTKCILVTIVLLTLISYSWICWINWHIQYI